MGWIIIVMIAYTPLLYRMQKRISYLENEVEKLKNAN